MDLNKEVLKGHIDTLILAILEKNDSYGFEIAKNVLDQTAFELKDGTLYISLKRLESKGLIESYWKSSQGPGNRRKYYKITEEGIISLDLKVQEWTFVKNIMNKYLEGEVLVEIINNYINLLYKDDDSIEVMELKEELKEHLILSANEFINQGYGENDAYNKAIEKFDGGSDMLKELYLTLKKDNNKLEKDNISLKKTTNKIIYVCRTILILFLVALVSSTVLHKTGVIENAQLKKWDALNMQLEQNLSSIIQNKDIYDIDSYIDSVTELIKSENILMLRLYKDEDSAHKYSDDSKDMIYEYGTKNVISYFDGYGETYENNKGQVLYFRFKPDTGEYYKLSTQIRISILLSAPIIIIGYVIIELLARRNNCKSI